MIVRISKIKGLGIFSDFNWPDSLADFARYNVIYGPNGSGKTTLSKLFSVFPTGTSNDYPDLKYLVDTTDGPVTDGAASSIQIRVFSQDYVRRNVYTLNGKATPIYILGEENKKLIDEINEAEKDLREKRVKEKSLNDSIAVLDKRKGLVYTDIARIIGQSASGSVARNYRKPEAERDMAALKEKSLLDNDGVKSRIQQLNQRERSALQEIAVATVGKQPLEVALQSSSSRSAALCAQVVQTSALERLKSHNDIAAWVEQGVVLHRSHASTSCEFCGLPLTPERMKILALHFTEEDRIVKEEIDSLSRQLLDIETLVRSVSPVDKANLYDEMQADYQVSVDQFSESQLALANEIASLRRTLDKKKRNTTEAISDVKSIDARQFLKRLSNVNNEIRKHNHKCKNFKLALDSVRKELVTHFLSTVYDEIKDLEKEIQDKNKQLLLLREGDPSSPGRSGIESLLKQIESKRAIVSSSHKGCEEINFALKTFLGRDELKFVVEGDGYILMRGDMPADNLSEGEKTAVGFVHFVVHLRDNGFDPATGVIVVDDPVSSLDSNSLFQAFAFLKNAVKDAGQVFLLTHNFDFLRLLLGWILHARTSASYYMIKNVHSEKGRSAQIHKLDELLKKHESEYHYLFKTLYEYKDDGTIESAYNIPNIARKVLDTFLMFRVPSRDSQYEKLESLRAIFDPNKLTAIYKFTNDQSHITGKGFDPSLVPETQKNVKWLLEMIATVFPEHYKIMVESIVDGKGAPANATSRKKPGGKTVPAPKKVLTAR